LYFIVDVDTIPSFHNVWEFWAYNVVFGLFQAPYYAFSQTMMAELSPPGFDNMVRLTSSLLQYTFTPSPTPCLMNRDNLQFFGLFGLSNRASSMIGPNVIQAIINKSGNNWDGFPFLFVLCTSASLTIWFGVDVPKGRRAAAQWAVERRGTALCPSNNEGMDRASVASSRKS
jgi:MFS-type transporter involved in bile tolerance (Atg22 family)